MQALFNADLHRWEIWTPINGYENYVVSNYGSIANATTGKILRDYCRDKSQYGHTVRKVKLKDADGKLHNLKVHRLVAQAYCEDYFPGCVVHHIDFNPENNSAENLQCMTRSEHIKLHNEDRKNVVVSV